MPGYFYVPVPLGIVDDRQILSHLAPGGNIHLKDGLEWFGLDCEDESVPADIGFRFVADQDVGGKLIDRVFADNSEGDFVLNRQHFVLPVFLLDLGLLL